MTTDAIKTERNLSLVADENTNDASVHSVSGAGGGSGSVAPVAGTPKESAKSQSVRRTVAKPVFEKDKHSFLCDLQMFHEKNGTSYMKLPKISGKEVDLHKLYSVVISRGGWMKVNAREDWDEVIEELDLPTRCVNNEIALKQIYIRYLDRYERVNFHGEDKDPAEDEDDEKRLHRRWSVRMLHSTPTVYNHHQHNVPETLRSTLKLSDDLYHASEYDKLILSLLSPLPNEQDFAINVCTLMSNENKHTLKVDKCPRLIYALLAHAGVFNHFTLRDTFDEYYSNIRKNSLHRFWKDCLFEKPQVLELSLEDYFAKMDTDPSALIASIYHEDQDEQQPVRKRANDSNEDIECDEDVDFGDLLDGQLKTATLRSFLSLGTGLGTNDYIGQRVLQVAAIFRNLSFNEENLQTLGSNRTFIRFLIMCSNSRWNNLHHLGLDMLGNIANEIEVNDPQSDEVTRCLLFTLSEGLEGADRGVIISCLEVLSKIAQKESNEENLNRCLNRKLYEQISLFLCLNDIMLLLYTLECIYSLTSMGERPCSAFVHIRGVVDTLVSLVTVEAQSYGPDACILMRVVETIPGNMAAQGAYYQNTNANAGQMQVSNAPPTMAQLTVHKDAQTGQSAPGGNNSHVVYQTPDAAKNPVMIAASTKPIPSPPTAQQTPQQTIVPPQGSPQTHQTMPGQLQNNQIVITGQQQQQQQQQQATLIQRSDSTGTIASHVVAVHPNHQQQLNVTNSVNSSQSVMSSQPNSTPPTSMAIMQSPISVAAAKQLQQQQALESEQFAYAWLRATFEAAAGFRTEQQEVYKLYLTSNGKLGRKVVVSQPLFPRCVRAVFGSTIGPVQLKLEQNGIESIGWYYEGVKLRPKPLPIVHKGAVLKSTVKSVSVDEETACSTTKQEEPIATTVTATTVIAAKTSQPTPTTSTRSIITQTSVACPTSSSSSVVSTEHTLVSTTVAAPNRPKLLSSTANQEQPAKTATVTIMRSASVIATAPPSNNTSSSSAPSLKPIQQPAGQPPGSSGQKTISSQTGHQQSKVVQFTPSKQQQPAVVGNVSKASLVTKPPASVTIASPAGGATSSVGKQIIVTQVGGKSVVINHPSAGQQQHQYLPAAPSSPLLQQVLSGEQKNNVIVLNQTTISPQPMGGMHQSQGSAGAAHQQTGTGTTTIMNQSGTISSTTTNPSALIKSLLANKVAQRQQLQKQKQMYEQKQLIPSTTASVVVTSNNPNNLTNIKVGNSTISIKPGTLPTNTVITATNPHEAHGHGQPPPLAPLSQSGTMGANQGTIIKTIVAPDSTQSPAAGKVLPNKVLSELLEKKPVEMIIAGETTIKRKIDAADASPCEPPMKRIESGGGELMYNKVEPKTADLYAKLAGSILEGEDDDAEMRAMKEAEAQAAKLKLQQQQLQQQQQQFQQQQQQLQQQQQQLQQQIQQQQLQLQLQQQQMQQQMQQRQQQEQQQQQQQVITMPVSMQRQIIVTPTNNPQQMIISTPGNAVASQQQQHHHHLTSQTTATIKTDSGYQTVPIILQHNSMPNQLQIQKTTATGGGGTMLQPTTVLTASAQHQPQQTQYILATNPQGQTYVVAQQPHHHQPQPQLQQTVLLAQGQQHGSGQKTIIIVQQQQPQPQPGGGGNVQQIATMQPQGSVGSQTTQKIFVNQQGQQILMTQLPRQMIVSHAGAVPTQSTAIITSAAPTTLTGTGMLTAGPHGGTIIEKKPIFITTNAQGNTISFEGPLPQQLQMQAAAAGGSFQLKQSGGPGVGSGGQQTIQFIPQGQISQGQTQTSTQQIVFQAHGAGSPTVVHAGHGAAQIIQQQIIQPAPGQQPQQIVQKVLQQQLVQGAKPNPSQIITVQQKQQPTIATITQQQQQVQQFQQQQQQLPQTISIQRQQTIMPAKPVTIPNVGPTLVSSIPGQGQQQQHAPQKQQIIQVVQQKIAPTPASAPAAPSNAQGQTHAGMMVSGTSPHPQHRQVVVTPGGTLTSSSSSSGIFSQTTITQTVVSAASSGPTPTPAPVPSITVTPIVQGQALAVANVPSNVAAVVGGNTGMLVASSPASSSPAIVGGQPVPPQAQPTIVANAMVPSGSPVAVVTAPAAIAPQPNTGNPIANAAGGGGSGQQSIAIQMIPAMDPQKIVEEDVDPNWPWVCDWRGCPRKKFQSAMEVFRHACNVHCPDTVDVSADIYCQWGPGPNWCDNLPRKRFSLMTHILDRHCTAESFKAAVQRRLSGAPQTTPSQPYPVTLVRQPGAGNGSPDSGSSSAASSGTAGERGSPAPASCTKVDATTGATTDSGSGSSSNGPGQLSAAGPAALHAMKRHSMDYINSKELQDEMEGPVTKSIRLTAALILRNLVVYTNSAKRTLRMYESHLAGVALSNVESSRTVAQLLFEMNDDGTNF